MLNSLFSQQCAMPTQQIDHYTYSIAQYALRNQVVSILTTSPIDHFGREASVVVDRTAELVWQEACFRECDIVFVSVSRSRMHKTGPRLVSHV